MTSEGLSLAGAPLAVASRVRSTGISHFIRACLLVSTPVPLGRRKEPALSAIYENGFSVKAHLLIPVPPVDGAAGPVSPSLLAMVAGVARRSRGPSQDSTIHLSAHVGA